MMLHSKTSVGIAALVLLLVPATIFWFVFRSTQNPDNPPPAKPEEKEITLDPDKQKVIWDNEHITFEIEHHFGRAFRDKLLDGTSQDVAAFFREGFQGQALKSGEPEARSIGLLRERRIEGEAVGHMSKDAAAMADYLKKYAAPFKKVHRQTLRVLHIEQLENERRWKTHILLALEGPDASGRMLMHQSEHHLEHTIPEEVETEIGEIPSVDRWKVLHEIRREAAAPLFEEVTESYGLAGLDIHDNWKRSPDLGAPYHFQVAVADYNRDGFLDIALCRDDARPLLLESVEGKRFKEVTVERGLPPQPALDRVVFAVCWLDYDNDGWPDLLMRDRLYRNEEGKRFVDVHRGSGLEVLNQCMGAVPADYDCDGDTDLYLLYSMDVEEFKRLAAQGKAPKESWVDEEGTGRPNALFRNEGNGIFRNVTEESNTGGGPLQTYAASWFFHDEDHYPDLYLANDFGKNVLLRNKGDGTFEDVAAQAGAQDFATSMGVATGDINNDGRSDIYVANMFSKMGRRIIGQLCDADYPEGLFPQIRGSCAGNRLYVRDGSEYREISEPAGVNGVGWAFAPALGDLDGNGLLDIYAATGYMSFVRGEPDG